MKAVVASIVALSLAGCVSAPQFITKEKLTVIEPDHSLYSCPSAGKFPNPDTLTDVQVAKLRGRGDVIVFQTPNRRNHYTLGFRIEDHAPGADDYRVALNW